FSNATCDESIFDVLLPLKDAWRDGRLTTPVKFASHSLCERAFNELLFCEIMVVMPNVDRPSFLALPSVRDCTSLHILNCSKYKVSEILGWLKSDARSKEPKRLKMYQAELNDIVDNLVQRLKTDFNESKTAHRYTFKISVDEPYDGQVGRFVNEDTSEMLIVSCYEIDADDHSVEVERKPLDKQ
ncbi:hypothetical protein AAVH_34362, partial [Aphelenchoides avenae]